MRSVGVTLLVAVPHAGHGIALTWGFVGHAHSQVGHRSAGGSSLPQAYFQKRRLRSRVLLLVPFVVAR